MEKQVSMDNELKIKQELDELIIDLEEQGFRSDAPEFVVVGFYEV